MTEERRAPVAVVVVSWNSSRFLSQCLGSLKAMVRRPAEIVVVDNGSVDGSQDLVRADFPDVRLIECGTNLGFCRANNLGIDRTSSSYVLVLNPDTRLAPEFLEELLPAFDDPRVGMVAGKLLRFDGRTLDTAGQGLARSRQPKERGFGRRDHGQFERDEEVFGVCAAAALYRRTMLDSIRDPSGDLFDEAFFAFYEDLDVAWRARRLGWRAVYRHRAVGYHARGGTSARPGAARWRAALSGRSDEVRYHITKNRYLTILRNDSPRDYLLNLPFILSRDLATIGILLVSSPGVLLRLWSERRLFRDALRKRRADAVRARTARVRGATVPPS